MVDNVLSLNRNKENVYSFKISAEGISADDLTVYFYITTPKMRLMFKCTADNNDYTCTIPALDFIEKTAYNCGLFVQSTDGYFFEPFKGTVNITSGVTITAQPGKDISQAIKSAVNSEPSQKPKLVDIDVDDIISKLDKIETKVDKVVQKDENKDNKNESVKKTTEEPKDNKKDAVKEILTPQNIKDNSVSAILTELGINVSKPRRRSTVILEGTRMPASIKSKLR